VPPVRIRAWNEANFAAPHGQIENPHVKELMKKYLRMKVEGKRARFRVPRKRANQVERITAQTFPFNEAVAPAAGTMAQLASLSLVGEPLAE